MAGESATYLQRSFEHALDPALLADAEGVIRWHNASAGEALGLRNDSRADLQSVFPPGDARNMLASLHYGLIETSVSLPQQRSFIAVVTVIDGPKLNDELFAIVLKSPDPRTRDVSEREEFLGTAAHDLKNPLGAIFGYADALLDTRLGSGIAEEQRLIISRIRGTANRCLDLVRNYQHLATIQRATNLPAGQVRASVELDGVIRSVIDYTWRDEARAPVIKVKLNAGAHTVGIDRVQLERVVGNILSNAYKFTPPDGEVKVSSGTSGSRKYFEITNSGDVVGPEDLAHMFKKYWRGKARDGIPGSGLGLYIVKLILDSAGATISVNSSEADGTTFRVEFP